MRGVAKQMRARSERSTFAALTADRYMTEKMRNRAEKIKMMHSEDFMGTEDNSNAFSYSGRLRKGPDSPPILVGKGKINLNFNSSAVMHGGRNFQNTERNEAQKANFTMKLTSADSPSPKGPQKSNDRLKFLKESPSI